METADLKNKVVVITGASAGLGRAAAVAFAKEGAVVGLIARNDRRLEEAKKEIEERGGKAWVVSADVSDYEALSAAADEMEEHLGPIDVWVNNAMVSVLSPVKDMSPQDFKRVTEVTYLGYVYGCLIALKKMEARGSGVIVQVGSALAIRSIPLQSAYCAAKHAIAGFTESLRTELLHDQSPVRISIVQMPALNTPQFEWVKTSLEKHPQPVPPIYQPEVGADAIVHAARFPKKEYWVGFSTMKAIVGEKLASNFADHYLAKNGFDSQQTDGLPMDPDRKNNLWSTVEADYGSHGSFDRRSRSSSVQWWASKHRYRAFGMGLGMLAGVFVGSRMLR